MNAESLRLEARRYRRLARGINDEKTIKVLEEMAREMEFKAGAIDAELRARSAVGQSRKAS
jgi:hypothetical protein